MVDNCIISKFVLHLDEASVTIFVIFLVTEALLGCRTDTRITYSLYDIATLGFKIYDIVREKKQNNFWKKVSNYIIKSVSGTKNVSLLRIVASMVYLS